MSVRRAVLESTEYEPFDMRTMNDQTNRFETLVNLVKAILGTGVLAMPQAFLHSGLLLGTVGLIIIVILLTYCLHLLFGAMYFFSKRDKVPYITYPEAFKEGLKIGPVCLRKCANVSPYFVNFFIIVYQFGIMCVYFVFCARNIKQLVDHYTEAEKPLTIEIYLITLVLPFLALSLIKNLKYLAPVSNIANWLTVLALLCIYYFFFETMEPIYERKAFADISVLPLFVGTSMFSSLAVGPVLEIELNMKDPRYWGGTFGILTQGMLIVGFLSLFTGFFGYWRYGEDTEAVVVLNIDIEYHLAQAIRILFCAAIILTYPLQAYPAHNIFWTRYVEKHIETSKHKMLWDNILRTIFVLCSYIVAVFVPHLGLCISLCGTFCLSILGVMFPAFLDICIRWPDDLGERKILFVRDSILIIFGFICWVSGTYVACKEIVEAFINKK